MSTPAIRKLLLITLLFGTAAGCASAPTVQRVHPSSEIDLSGNWNDTDANTVAQAMIHDCLSRPWARQFYAQKGQLPVIRMYPIRNRTMDHINDRFFSKQVEMELLNSGTVKVVADLEEAQDPRLERADQAVWAAPETVKPHKRETGSDFVLNGWVLAQDDAADGVEVRSYITTMELTNSETNEKVWIKAFPIKKLVTRPAYAW